MLKKMKFITILSVIFVVGQFFSPTVSAASNEININSEEFQSKSLEIEKYIKIKDGVYYLDRAVVNDGIINEAQYVDANKALEVYSAKDSSEVSTRVALSTAAVAFLGTLAVFVGWELATQITEDFYTWGVTSACKKWKNTNFVNSFCTANGYL